MESTFWIYLIICVQACTAPSLDNYHFVSHSDLMINRDQTKIKRLSEDLLKDMILKQRQLTQIKKIYSTQLAYEVGIVLGRVREKYKRMMDIYREMIDRYRKRHLLVGSGVWGLRPYYFIIAMEFLKGLEMDIDQSIQILENIPTELMQSIYAFGSVRNKGMLQPKDQSAHPGYLGSGERFIYLPKEKLTPTRRRPRRLGPPTKESVNFRPTITEPKFTTEKVKVDFRGAPVPKFKSQEELKKYYRERYESNEKPKDNPFFLDQLYGIV